MSFNTQCQTVTINSGTAVSSPFGVAGIGAPLAFFLPAVASPTGGVAIQASYEPPGLTIPASATFTTLTWSTWSYGLATTQNIIQVDPRPAPWLRFVTASGQVSERHIVAMVRPG